MKQIHKEQSSQKWNEKGYRSLNFKILDILSLMTTYSFKMANIIKTNLSTPNN